MENKEIIQRYIDNEYYFGSVDELGDLLELMEDVESCKNYDAFDNFVIRFDNGDKPLYIETNYSDWDEGFYLYSCEELDEEEE